MTLGEEVLLVFTTCVVILVVFLICTLIFVVFGPKYLLAILTLFIIVGTLRIVYLVSKIK